jgi:hypothetical protein
MTCQATQERMAAMLAGAVGQRERVDIETHAARCARCGTVLRDVVFASVALDRAYAPLRARTVALSPARVRMTLRIPEPALASTRFSRFTARLTEFGLAAAVTAFAFAGSASVADEHTIVDEAAAPEPATTATHVTAGTDDQYVFRWLRIGRYAPQSDVLDPAVAPQAYVDESAAPIKPERSGLVR